MASDAEGRALLEAPVELTAEHTVALSLLRDLHFTKELGQATLEPMKGELRRDITTHQDRHRDALGRRLSFTDRDDVDRIVTLMPTLNYGLRELIIQVVASEPFRSK